MKKKSLWPATDKRPWPLTRPERSQYRETSRYEDVLTFLNELRAKGAPITVQFIGESPEGRPIPLVVVSRPAVSGRAEAIRSGKVVVYIQANIHGGEVEGKEAVQIILRQMALDSNNPLLDRLVLLIVPVYNIDGNEAWGPSEKNRSHQNGPEMIGLRANGQGLDLNRDCIKAESNETQAVLKHVYTAWDPHVVIDLHATNGTRHGYDLTYAPPLNPNTDAGIVRYSRDELLPRVRERLQEEHGVKTFDYGGARKSGDTWSWRTFSPEPRFVTNYVGLRNRIGILSEATSFLPFRRRVEATRLFVLTVLEKVAHDSGRLRQLLREADERVIQWGQNPEKPPDPGLRFISASRGIESILLEDPASPEAVSGKPVPPARIQKIEMAIYDRFEPTDTSPFPSAYIFPPQLTEAADLLRVHGLVVERYSEAWKGAAQVFEIEKVEVINKSYFGPRRKDLTGRFALKQVEIPKGSYLVKTAQPLGVLAFYLLEPESLDGLTAWGFFDEALRENHPHPVMKIPFPE